VLNIKRKIRMKKIYKNPETKVVKVQTSQIIAASPAQVQMYGKGATSAGMSRRSWSDDEEED
jgi:hypothetical protein